MEKKAIYITHHDLTRLRKLIHERSKGSRGEYGSVKELEDELSRGIVVAPKNIPENVITMNSRVLLKDLDSGRTETYWLVFPDKVNAVKNPVSILSPLGTAMIGYKVGEVFDWESPSGRKQMEVLDILYQPERVGNFNF